MEWGRGSRKHARVCVCVCVRRVAGLVPRANSKVFTATMPPLCNQRADRELTKDLLAYYLWPVRTPTPTPTPPPAIHTLSLDHPTHMLCVCVHRSRNWYERSICAVKSIANTQILGTEAASLSYRLIIIIIPFFGAVQRVRSWGAANGKKRKNKNEG